MPDAFSSPYEANNAKRLPPWLLKHPEWTTLHSIYLARLNPMIPQEVTNWIDSHKGGRHPVYAPGSFEQYAFATTSDCWGQPKGGTSTGNFLIAVCQPTPDRGGTPTIFYDYIPKP